MLTPTLLTRKEAYKINVPVCEKIRSYKINILPREPKAHNITRLCLFVNKKTFNRTMGKVVILTTIAKDLMGS